MIERHNNAFYGYVIALAIVSGLLAKWLGTEDAERRKAVPHSADFFSVGYQKWQMNDRGNTAHKLSANKMTHYNDDGTTHLENPLMFFYNAQNLEWQIQSETGILEKGSDKLRLNGNVDIERAENAKGRKLTIHTSNLEVIPSSHFAQTSEFTQLRSGANVTTGLGMKAIFSTPVHLELLAKVHGNYDKK